VTVYTTPGLVVQRCPTCGHDLDSHVVRWGSRVVVLEVDGDRQTVLLCDGVDVRPVPVAA
jgi:hypothetical protein